MHICYGYGIEANSKWKETLGAEWRQYEQSFPLLQQSSIDIVSLKCIHSHVPLDRVELIGHRARRAGRRAGPDGALVRHVPRVASAAGSACRAAGTPG